jgi:cobalt-zinc-cadmium efflux system protein
VAPVPIIIVSLIGVLVNGCSAWLFASGSKDDVNIRAAFMHLASDAAVAAGVAVTGVIIHFTGLHWIDSAASLAVSAIVIASTWSLLRRAVNLALHAVPEGLDEDEIRAWLAKRPDVIEVHDLHVWAMSTRENILTAHLVTRTMPTGARVCEIDAELQKAFRIHHVTLQFEPQGAPCGLLGPESI